MIENFISNHYLMDKITLKDKLMNQTGGGDTIFNMYIHYIIGIILIVLGIILIKSQEEWGKTTGIVKNIFVEKDSLNLLLEYNVSNNKFIRNTISQGENYKIGDQIDILYDKINPNIIKLHEFNYKYIGIIIGIIGIFTFIKF